MPRLTLAALLLTAAPIAAADPDLDAVARRIVERTNAFRKKEGREPTAANKELAAAATYFAGFMADTGKYGHEADDRKPADRAKDKGYDYCLVSENIAYVFDPAGYTTETLADQLVKGWQDSPGHRKNMLDPHVTDTGVAVARRADNGYYYAVQMFGRPKAAAFEFRIANRTETAVKYTVGDQEYELPPRVIITHTVCLPSAVTFRWPGENAGTQTVTPTKGERFDVTAADGKFTATKAK